MNKLRFVRFAFAIGILASPTGTALAGAEECYEVEIVNVANAGATNWWGINDRNQVVGSTCTAMPCTPFPFEGARLDTRTCEVDVYPGPLGTDFFVEESDINNWGTTAGFSVDFSQGFAITSFTRDRHGNFELLPILFDDTQFQYAYGINDWGTVVGRSERTGGLGNVGWIRTAWGRVELERPGRLRRCR